jgi:hypothetical protein
VARLISALNVQTGLVVDVTGRGAELVRGVASGGATALLCCVSSEDVDWRRSVQQVALGCEGLPWGVSADADAPLDEAGLLAVLDAGADYVILPAETFPAWGLDVLESFPGVGRLVSATLPISGDQAQVIETLGPQAFAARIEDPELTIQALAGLRIVAESLSIRTLLWMPELTARDSRLSRQVGVGGFVIGVGADEPDRVMSRVHRLAEALAEPVKLRSPIA